LWVFGAKNGPKGPIRWETGGGKENPQGKKFEGFKERFLGI